MTEIESADQSPVQTTNDKLARAYRDIESRVFDICNAAQVLDMVAEEALERDEDLLKWLGLSDGFFVYVIGEKESSALFYAMYHVGNLADELVDQWTKGLKGKEPGPD